MEIPAGFGNQTFRYALAASDEEKTFSLGFRAAAGGSEAQLKAAAEDMLADYKTTFHTTPDPEGTMLVPWVFRGSRVLTNVAGVLHSYEYEDVIVGDAAGAAPTVNTTLLVKKKTGLAGRTNRGRMYVPLFGFDESGLDVYGEMTSGDLAIFQGLWDDFFALGTGAGLWIPVLLHADGSAEAPDDITSFVVSPIAATQRRRMR